jgi:hypothetical protein
MAALGPPSVDPNGDPPLDERLERILVSGFQSVGDCVILADFEAPLADSTVEQQRDATALEAFVNHCHVDDELDLPSRDPTLLAQAARYAGRLAAELAQAYPGERFLVILTVGDSCIVRFHKVRPDESWLRDDLESYADEAVMTVAVSPS